MEQISGINFQLVSPSRRYFDEGFLSEKSIEKKNLKKRYIFLFNNLLLITSLTKKGGGGGTLKGGTLGREGGEGGKETTTTTGGGKKGSYGKRGGEVITGGGSQGKRLGSRVTMGGGTMGGIGGGGEGELFQFNYCIDFQNVELFDVEGGGEGGKEEGRGFGLEFGFGVRKVAGIYFYYFSLFYLFLFMFLSFFFSPLTLRSSLPRQIPPPFLCPRPKKKRPMDEKYRSRNI